MVAKLACANFKAATQVYGGSPDLSDSERAAARAICGREFPLIRNSSEK